MPVGTAENLDSERDHCAQEGGHASVCDGRTSLMAGKKDGDRVNLLAPTKRKARTARVVAGCALLLLFASFALARFQSARSVQADATLQSLRAAAASDRPSINAAGSDFLATLSGARGSAEQAIATVDHTARALGVSLASVSTTRTEPTPQSLGRLELSITLRGSYTNLKQVIAETLDRFPAAVLQQLAFRRAAPGTDLEAQVRLTLLSAPAPQPPAPATLARQGS